MIYSIPALSDADEHCLQRIGELRTELRFYVHTPRRWLGTLRRAVFARAVQGSNSIEGFHASVEDVAAVIDDEEPSTVSDETRQAIAGYRDAMTFVIQLASTSPAIDVSLLRSLHFMMVRHDLAKHPGRWRPGEVWVQDGRGDVVYQAPDRELIESLIDELMDQIATSDAPAMVTAAMAHLNLTLIHPFSDGNGRMARCLQTLVLGYDGELTPEFCSIEAYLGYNTQAYYDALHEVAGGRWSPSTSARSWIGFSLTAHYRQARNLLTRVRETEALWDRCEQTASRHGLPDRVVGALCDSARGWRLRRSLYVKIVRSATGDDINDAAATRDLSAMVSTGLLRPVGEKRGRHYEPTADLRRHWSEIRAMRPPQAVDDPYRIGFQQHLPGTRPTRPTMR